MTTYELLLRFSGIRVDEAASFHEVDESLVRSWLDGSEDVPAEAMRALRDLIARQDRAAAEGLAVYRNLLAEHGRPAGIDQTVAKTVLGAQKRGWPTVSASEMVLARIIAGLDIDFKLVPDFPD